MNSPKPDFRPIVVFAALLLILAFAYVGCGGRKNMTSPQLYGAPAEDDDTLRQVGPNDTIRLTEPKSALQTGELGAGQEGTDSGNAVSHHSGQGTDTESEHQVARPDGKESRHSSKYRIPVYYGSVDNSDSAAAVDDDIWRLFDLAEEYHAMGAIANREASWEEAQYYFEKCLKILASLDIESDSVLTPEATKYNELLDNVVSDYRVALRSLGQLEGNTAPSVLIERFGDIEKTLGADSLEVYKSETEPITYDLPIVINDRVKKSIIYYQTVGREVFEKFLTRRYRYEKLLRDILSEYGLPHDLIYLSMVESGYNPHAYSWARAMGLWQFIASTGRLYGLKRSWWVDERKDPIKSTHAAARFLKDLYDRFGDWELAMAAYNGGPGRVSRTIKHQGTKDFWKMRLRRQTMDYVPLIYAATIIAKDPERYGFSEIEPENPIDWDEVEIDRCLDLKIVAKELGTSLQELKNLNPELLRNYTPPNEKKYTLKIPVGLSDKFVAAYDNMPSPKETSWVRHRIRRGETVSTIAAKYGVSQYAVLEANNLSRRSTIYAGRSIIVPVPLDRDYSGSRRTYEAEGSIYTVRAGDTMWDIARAFGTNVESLRGINYIERGSRIYVGQKLRIPADAAKLKSRQRMPRQYASSAGSSNSSSGGKGTYKVRRGDTLWDIARSFGTTTSYLRRLNGLGRSSRIYPGQILVVGSGDNVKYVIHRVRRGDTLSRIARQYRTSIARILANNDLIDPDNIKVGDRLKIYVN